MLNLNILPKKQAVIPASDLIVDWSPQEGEIILAKDPTSGRYKFFMYAGLWNDIRTTPNDGNFEASPFLNECMPYCQTEDKEIIRVKGNYAYKTGANSWEISNNFDYLDAGFCLQNTRVNRLYAKKCNRARAFIVTKDLAVAS